MEINFNESKHFSKKQSFVENNLCISVNLDLTKMSYTETYTPPPEFDTKLLEIVLKFDGNPLELFIFLDNEITLLTIYSHQKPINLGCVQNV